MAWPCLADYLFAVSNVDKCSGNHLLQFDSVIFSSPFWGKPWFQQCISPLISSSNHIVAIVLCTIVNNKNHIIFCAGLCDSALRYHQNPIQIYFCEDKGEFHVAVCEVTNTSSWPVGDVAWGWRVGMWTVIPEIPKRMDSTRDEVRID